MIPKEMYDEKIFDENTGDTIFRKKVPENFVKEIEDSLKKSSEYMNNFVQISRQIEILSRQRSAEFDKINKTEQETTKNIIFICEKMSLDTGWVYNIPLKSMEKRQGLQEEEQLLGEGVKK